MGQKKKLLIFLSILFLNIFCILASPELTNVEFTSDDGYAKAILGGNLKEGFFLDTDNNASTNYEIQFSYDTGVNEQLKKKMFGLYLVDSTVSISDLKDYYDARGVPEPFLSYLKNAADGTNPFAYINGSTIGLVDAAQYDILGIQKGMIIPGDYPTGIYTVKGKIENTDNEKSDVTFIIIIGIIISNKVEIDSICPLIETDNITLGADLIGSIDSVWISYTINGTNYNKTASKIINNTYRAVIQSSELVGGMNLTWNIYGKSPSGRVDSNGEKTFYVRKSTSLLIFPSVPDGLNGWYVTEPEFRLVKDNIGEDTYYRWDSTALILYTDAFGLENIPNAPPKQSAGILDLHWWTNFPGCGDEDKQTALFHVDLTDPSIINLQPTDKVYSSRPVISAYLDEIYQSNSGINKSSFIIKLDGVDITSDSNITKKGLDSVISYVPDSDLSLGNHKVYVYCMDNAGRSSELNWSFSVETSLEFNLLVNSPKNTTYNSKKILFDINTTREASIEYINYNNVRPKWINLCTNCYEYNKTKMLHEGWNNITIKAEDNYGKTKEENLIFFIDSKKPLISKTEPKRGSFTNGSDFYIKYSEDNPKELSITYNSTEILDLSKCSDNGRYKECYYDLNLIKYEGQEIEYYFKLADIANNTDESKPVKVKVDTTPPKINNLNDSIYKTYKSYAYFNISITENNLNRVEYFDLNDSRARWRTLCIRLRNGICEKKVAFDGTSPNLLIRVLDEAGNAVIEHI